MEKEIFTPDTSTEEHKIASLLEKFKYVFKLISPEIKEKIQNGEFEAAGVSLKEIIPRLSERSEVLKKKIDLWYLCFVVVADLSIRHLHLVRMGLTK